MNFLLLKHCYFLQICEMLKSPTAKDLWSDVHKVPYLVDGSTWIGYDNQRSFDIKVCAIQLFY